MKPDDETLRTSWTLVARIKNLDDQESWREVFELYQQLILRVAVKAGLRENEADEVLQETMVSLAKHIGEFEANPKRGSFRAWLLKMARWRIQDQFRKRLPMVSANSDLSDATAATPTIERVPDAREVDLERLCDAEWKETLMEEALKKLPSEVKAEHYQIFHLLTVKQKSIGEVARLVGRNRAQIYVIKHRVSNALKKIISQLGKEEG